MSGGSPAVATTPRTTMPYASSLTTVDFDPLNRSLYQIKTIGGQDQECVLVGTFASDSGGFWSRPGGTLATLTYTIGSTTHYIFPYVTVGNDLHNYLTSTYFSGSTSPTDAQVALRIDQSLGLDPSIDLTVRGLAFFWAPISSLVRSGYSPNVATTVANLQQFSDGSYIPEESGIGAGFNYVDIKDNTILYSTNTDFVSYNQAQTNYPWTAMGYTYNWNALQDGSNPAFGTDPFAPSSYVGLSEFMVSGGSQVLLESWVPYTELDTWVVPEPGTIGLIVLGCAVVVMVRRSRATPQQA